jgi:hypothetical protein
MFSKILNLFNLNTEPENKSKIVSENKGLVIHNIQPIDNPGYPPQSIKNNEILQTEKIKTNSAYRKYLTNNANTVQEYNYYDTANSIGYFDRPNEKPSIQSNLVSFNPYVIPNNSDLKYNYFSSQNNNIKKIIPEITIKKP